MAITAGTYRALALALPEATESAHMGHPDFRVGGKIFATLTADESAGAVKCDPASLDALVRSDARAFRNAWGGRWLGIDLARAEEDMVRTLLEDAWRMVAPKRLVRAHEQSGGART